MWAVIAAIGGVSGCGDDQPVETSGSSGAGSETDSTTTPTTEGPGTSVMTGDPGPTSDTPTTGDPTTGGPDSETATTDEPTTGTDTGGPNQAPVALVDNYIGKARQALTPSAAAGVLSNDFDPDGDPVTVIASDPLTIGGASLIMPPDGSFNYFPPPELWGSDTFTYKIWDGKDGFASTMVRIALNPTAIPLGALVASKQGFILEGDQPGDYSGRAVHHIGDVNSDGHGDLVVAARSAALNTGRIYVVFGKSTGGPIALGDLAEEQAGYEIVGAAPGDLAGTSVSPAGDVDGDGVPDLVLGAPGAELNGSSSGISYVVLGKQDSEPVFLDAVAVGEGGFSIEGEGPQHFSGKSVHGAGDVNGDGLADVIVGSYGAEPNGILSGRAYVVFGRPAGKPVHLDELSAGLGEGFVINGETEFDFAGSAVAGGGDINGDGLADVIVGAYGSDVSGDTAGRTYVVFGKPGVEPVELADIAAGNGGFAIDGESTFDQAGAAVGHAGDVNGDGLADVVIGAPLADPSGDDSGRSYVVFGKQDTLAVQLAQVTGGVGGFTLNGQQSRDYAGFAVEGAGDVNGDGLDDVLIGAYGANPMGDASGRSYLVFGKTDNALVSLNAVANGDGGFALDGEVGKDYSGFSVAGAGDVDGDGLADVMTGSFGNDAKGDGAGRSYVVFGGDYTNVVRDIGGPGPDNLAGTDAAEIFVAGRGDDTITGQGGADIFYCGAGDDTVRIGDLAFRRVDGGEGVDTLLLLEAGLELDLTARPDNDLVRVEVVDLSDGGHTLVLGLRDLLALTTSGHVLTVTGSQGNVEADLGGAGFADQGEVGGFHVYSDGVTTLRVAVALAKNVVL